ncbi:MAG: DUF502 domain-containing protein [Rhodopirellula sp.]|nr:DUF502 domain-containing protein [Rhodopirellula sp.]
MIVLVPIGVTLLVMRWILQWMAGFLLPFVEGLTSRLATALGVAQFSTQAIKIPLMLISIAGFLLAVYFTGALAQAVVGRRLLHAGETVLMRIPLAGTIYSAAKQVMEAIAAPTRSALRTAVLVEFPRREAWSIGFITGQLAEAGEQSLLKVFVPTTPNPTTGFFLMVPRKDVMMTDMTIEEAFKMIISGGIVSPATMKGRPFPEGAGVEETNVDA